MNVGIVGGGQLARMLALAGYPLGLRFQMLDPAARCLCRTDRAADPGRLRRRGPAPATG
jgi:phosphoribosylaminoimidazole carboxylase (NCAIR synthetase)